jgi:hypothetical protein
MPIKGTWIHLLAFAPAITVPLTSVYNNKIQTTGNATLDIALKMIWHPMYAINNQKTDTDMHQMFYQITQSISGSMP